MKWPDVACDTVNQTNPIIEEHESQLGGGRSGVRRRAILFSVIFHFVLIGVLVIWSVPRYVPSSLYATISKSAAVTGNQNATTITPDGLEDEVQPDQLEKSKVQHSVQAHIEHYQKFSDERKLSELEENLKRLEKVATPESVQEVTTTIASTLGLDTSQYAPKPEPNFGAFDMNTGQLHDVVRIKDKLGTWKYESILVDAAGRTMSVPMTEAEGEAVYDAFQQMKKFPMAAGIYRSVVMPLVQQMMKAQELAEEAANEAVRLQRQQQKALPR